jgi:hypothetical protein
VNVWSWNSPVPNQRIFSVLGLQASGKQSILFFFLSPQPVALYFALQCDFAETNRFSLCHHVQLHDVINTLSLRWKELERNATTPQHWAPYIPTLLDVFVQQGSLKDSVRYAKLGSEICNIYITV